MSDHDELREEEERIRERYKKREKASGYSKKSLLFSRNTRIEREEIYKEIILKKFPKTEEIILLEIGAGGGLNIAFFQSIGIPWENLYANELLADRVEILKVNIPKAHILPGNALDLDSDKKFDVVFQSTVFSSILDQSFKEKLAQKMMDLTKPSGLILWYDFIYDNPANKDVKGVPRKEVHHLFPGKEIKFHKVTLAPPLGRRIGRFYNIINRIFPLLRTHIIAAIHN